MLLTPGSRLGSYKITGHLGKGGMGEVYRARDTKLDRDVAIKVLPHSLGRDPDRLARFEREAKILGSLNHPNIATIYSLEESPEGQAIAMELVDGATLKSPLPLNTALHYASQIAEALEAAHEKGVTHRDLKPANIMVTAAGLIKVLDFGLAAVTRPPVGQDPDASTLIMDVTKAGSIMGTAAYMAPEQAAGTAVDRRADIWSYGVIVWQLLTGKSLFRADTAAQTLANVINAPIDFSKLPKTTPAPIRDLLQRCLERDIKSRLQWIGEARITIQKYLADPQSGTVRPVQAARLPRWATWATGGTLALAAAALVATAWVPWREEPQPAGTVRFQLAPENVSMASSFRFALSPDGTKLAYQAAGSDGVVRLWVRSMDTLDARPLPATEVNPNVPIFWFFDSKSVVFASTTKLKRIEVAGGPPQTLCTVPGVVVGGSWNRDGVILFGNGDGGPAPVMKISSEGGTPRPVTAIKTGEYHHNPVFLPDGRHFLYVRQGTAESSGVYVGSLDEAPEQQSPKRILATDGNVEFAPSADGSSGQIVYLREGTLFAQPFDLARLELAGDSAPIADRVSNFRGVGQFSASKSGALVYRTGNAEGVRLVWFDRQGNVLRKSSESGYGASTAAFSPDGSRAAAELFAGDGSNLWLVSAAQGEKTRFTYSRSGVDRFAAWSPDGTQVAFSSSRNGHFDLYQRSANGAGEDQLLLKSDTDKSAFDWSREGPFLLYGDVDAKGRRSLWVLPMDQAAGERKPKPLVGKPEFDESEARISADGRWIAYVGHDTGLPEVYVRPFTVSEEARGKWLVSRAGGRQPRWSRDGKELFFLSPSGQVLVTKFEASGAVFKSEVPKLLFEPSVVGGSAWDVSADGSRFLFPTAGGKDAADAPFTIVLNWQTALKR